MSLLTSCNWCAHQRLIRRHKASVVTTEPVTDWPTMPSAVRVLVDGEHVATYAELPERCISLDGGECLGREVPR